MAEAFEKHDLPSGGWVAFRDPKSLTRGQRKPLDRAHVRMGLAVNVRSVLNGEMSPNDLSDSEVDLLEGLMEAVVVVLTEDWSLERDVLDANGDPVLDAEGQPIREKAPIQIDSLDHYKPQDYEAVVGHAAKHRDALVPDFDPTPDRTDSEGRENPTGSSPASKTTSAAKPRAARSRTPSESGGS